MNVTSAAKSSRRARPKRDDRQFVNALGRGLEVLQCFTPATPELGTSEIARLTGLPQPTVWRLCHTMMELGFLIAVPGQERLRLGLPVLRLGFAVFANQNVGQIAKPYMEKVAHRYQGAVSLGVRDGLSMVYLQRCQGSSIILADLGVGSRVSLAFSATGWAYIAGAGDKERERLIGEIRAAEKRRWTEIEPLFTAAYNKFKKVGYIINKGSLHPQINAVAVPIYATDGSMLLSISSGGLSSVFTDDTLRQVGTELKQLAETLGPIASAETRL
jgi:DNA-binding IclR family transcriptional regulator